MFGTVKIPFNSFQKVWITPKRAEVRVSDGHPCKELGITEDDRAAFVISAELDVVCDCDLVAMKYNASAHDGEILATSSDFTIQVFREIVLPHIKSEVNESEHFVAVRQIYQAFLLATWFKGECHKITELKEMTKFVDSDEPSGLKRVLLGIEPWSPGNMENENDSACDHKSNPADIKIDHVTPDDPAFDIADNIEYYQKYINLFRKGVFRCVREEEGDRPGDLIKRVYFSGAIHLNAGPAGVVFKPLLMNRNPLSKH